MNRSNIQYCQNCKQPFDRDYIHRHTRQCKQNQQFVQIQNSQEQRNSQPAIRFQKQQSSNSSNNNTPKQINHQKLSEIEMPYPRCEFCDAKYPEVIFNEHLEYCEARLALLKIQKEESDHETIQQSHGHTNNHHDHRDHNHSNQQLLAQDDYSRLGPGRSWYSETLLPNGQVRIVHAIKDQNGLLSVQETMTPCKHNRNNRNQANFQQQSQHAPTQNQILVSGDRREGISLTNLFQQIMVNVFGVGVAEQGGLSEEEMNSINVVNYKKSKNLSEENKRCIICMTDYEEKENLKLLPCAHRFHNHCIEQWLKDQSKCPICKQDVREKH